jgi:hypothetical protein
MTREQRKQRRRQTAIYLIIAAAIIVTAIVTAEAETTEAAEQPDTRRAAAIVLQQQRTDYPVRELPEVDFPLDIPTQKILWAACKEWDVPYELALAVCWRETQYQHLVTPHGGQMYYGMIAVQLKSAKWYMEQCGVDNLDSIENSLRVGCCILGHHLKEYGSVEAALCRYSNDYEGWYAEDVMQKMGEIKKR